MSDFSVHRYGTDTSGRAIFMTTYMHNWWERVVEKLGFRPTIVQGAFMTRAGGGAAASAGYHDEGGCIDVRVWDLTQKQQRALVHTTRELGAASWVRDAQHGGMDPHCHITLGSDRPLTAGAKNSWASYIAGRDGLASNGPDYEWRPHPLVTKPPEDDLSAEDVWNHRIKTNDHTGRKSDNTRSAEEMLAQAHRRAGDARTIADRNRDAIEAMANKLEKVAPGIAEEVVKALGDKIEVDLNLKHEQE